MLYVVYVRYPCMDGDVWGDDGYFDTIGGALSHMAKVIESKDRLDVNACMLVDNTTNEMIMTHVMR